MNKEKMVTCLNCGEQFLPSSSRYEHECSRRCSKELDRAEEAAAKEYEERTGKSWYTFSTEES